MPAPSPRFLDRSVPLLAGACVVAFAAGSSSVHVALRVGHPLRWLVLLGLLVAAVAWSLPRPRLPRDVLWTAAALVALAVLSTAWSITPRTTLERAVSLALLFLTCAFLAAAMRGRPDRAAAVFLGLLGGAVCVGLLGLLELAFDHARAVVPASYESPARYQGFGQDPNTVALLFGVATPIGVWVVLSGRARVAGVLALLLLVGTIVATGSRGGLVAALVGSAVVCAASMPRRRALAAVVAVVGLIAVGLAIQSIPRTSTQSAAPARPAQTLPQAKPGYVDAEAAYPLSTDIGQPLPGGGQPPVKRSLLGGSGRADAWRGAVHEIARRPLVGHGFGTEQDTFVDRYYRFVGNLPENSYLGIALQLGIVGLAAGAALLVVLVRHGVRSLGTSRGRLAAAGLGVVAAGLTAALAQSYVYSVGNIAAAMLWIPAFALATIGSDDEA